MNQIIDQFLTNTYTYTDGLRRLRILKQHLNQQLFSVSKVESSQLSAEDWQWLRSLGEDFFKQFNSQNLTQQMTEIEKQFKAITPLVIYIPFELPEIEKQSLGQFVRQQFGVNFLIDIKLDPQLIGGCSIVWKGIYKDYSLRKRIEDNKQSILSSFRNLFEQ